MQHASNIRGRTGQCLKITKRVYLIKGLYGAVADPALELRGGGGGVLIYLPCRPFSLQSFLLFFTQNKGGRGGPRSATVGDSLS